MASGRTIGFVLVGVSLLSFFGIRKYKEVRALQSLTIAPRKPAFQLVKVNSGVIDCLLNLVLINPTKYQVNAKRIRVDIFINRGGSLVKLATVDTSALVDPKSQGELTVPTQLQFKQVVEFGRQFLLETTVPLLLRGNVRYVTSGISIPVSFEFQIDAKDQFLKMLS